MEKLFITNLEGGQIEVTDLEAAKDQAKSCVNMSKQNNNMNLEYWQHVFCELNKLKEPEPEPEIDTTFNGKQLSKEVIKCMKIFGKQRSEKGYIKNGEPSPLFSVHSCARSSKRIIEIESLEVGESINNLLTKITRVY